VALGPRGRRGRPESGEAGTGDGRGMVGEGSRGFRGPVWVLTRGGEVTGGRARWKPAAAATGVVTPASLQSSLGKKRVWKIQKVLGKVVVVLVVDDEGRKTELAVWGTHGAAVAARQWRNTRGEETGRPL
jgi:hypothetical protein